MRAVDPDQNPLDWYNWQLREGVGLPAVVTRPLERVGRAHLLPDWVIRRGNESLQAYRHRLVQFVHLGNLTPEFADELYRNARDDQGTWPEAVFQTGDVISVQGVMHEVMSVTQAKPYAGPVTAHDRRPEGDREWLAMRVEQVCEKGRKVLAGA